MWIHTREYTLITTRMCSHQLCQLMLLMSKLVFVSSEIYPHLFLKQKAFQFLALQSMAIIVFVKPEEFICKHLN